MPVQELSEFAPSVVIEIADPQLASGIVHIQFKIEGQASDYTLRGSIAGKNILTKQVVGPGEFWIALNSHLLLNGRVEIRFSLSAAGREIWSDVTQLNVVNTSWLARAVADSMRRHGTPLVLDGCVDTTHYDYADLSVQPWFDRPDAGAHIAARLAAGELSQTEADHLRHFVDDGYVILKGLIDPPLLKQVNAEIDQAIASKHEGYEYGSSQRMHGLHWQYPGIRQVWQHPKITHYLRLIFESEPRSCQTLTYVFGSQQAAHQDTVFLTPFPAGYMCGVWTALENVKPNSGELEVYKGSHRLPRIYMSSSNCRRGNADDFNQKVAGCWEKMIRENNFERVIYRADAGDVLIWHENLLHGGSPRIDQSLSRRSVVSHVFADGAVAYYDARGIPGYMIPKV